MTDDHTKTQSIAPLEETTHVHPLVRLAMRGGTVDPGTLRELLELQRAWERDEAKKAYIEALVALKRDLPRTVVRDKEVDFKNSSGVRTHYFHTSLPAFMEAIGEPLNNHGFTLNWLPSTTAKGDVQVTARLMHKAGHHEECSLSAPPDGKGGKNPAQAVMSTQTMLQRYTAMGLLGIASGDQEEDHLPSEEGPPPADRIDTKRSMAAAGWLKKNGISVAEAEQFIDRKVAEWTLGDLEDLKKWAQPQIAERTSP